MIQSEMPKGVEHSKAGRAYGLDPGVVQSEMPKGVEHCPMRSASGLSFLVVQSEMPKGVEHVWMPASYLSPVWWFNLRCRKALSTSGAVRVRATRMGGSI